MAQSQSINDSGEFGSPDEVESRDSLVVRFANLCIVLMGVGALGVLFRMKGQRNLSYFLMLAAAWSLIQVGNVYIPPVQPPPGHQTLKIMSFNVLGYNLSEDKVVEQMKEHDPDVICVVEYSAYWFEKLKCFDEVYPYQYSEPRWHGFGLAFFSKYPLSKSRTVALTNKTTDNPAIITNVSFGDQTIRLAGAHVFSPKTPFRLDLRNRQYQELAEVLSQDESGESLPTVMMGDFNSAPWSPFVQDFLKATGLRDSRRGFGYHASWHAGYFLLRLPIDHAFVSKDVHVHSRIVDQRRAGSDHLPIVFEISIGD